jgi:hypothetical protein
MVTKPPYMNNADLERLRLWPRDLVLEDQEPDPAESEPVAGAEHTVGVHPDV